MQLNIKPRQSVNEYLRSITDTVELRLSKYQMAKLKKGETIMVFKKKVRYLIGPKKGTAQTERQIKKLQEKIRLLKSKQK